MSDTAIQLMTCGTVSNGHILLIAKTAFTLFVTEGNQVPPNRFCLFQSKLKYRARICKAFKEPRIDFQPDGSVRQPYFLYRSARLHRIAESTPRNRFLGSLNVYKYGLRLFNQFQTEVLIQWYIKGTGSRYITKFMDKNE
jgi:hypothetical protein